ncbi:MAG: transketolase C-terminal domain-containing protein [Candidatus Jordarchaeaceae archaeon]
MGRLTPQTGVVEKLSDLVESGELNARFVRVESEHSALAACIGASLTGVRTFTATSAHGLAYMHEMVHWAAASRLPIVMAIVNRALGPPWNIWADHGDSVSQRDTGWLQIYCANHQDAFDSIIQAYKIAEDEEVLLPVMVCYEGFTISHTSQPVEIPEQEEVDAFLPPYNPTHIRVDIDNPITHGNLQNPDDWFYEFKYLMHLAQENAKKKIVQVASDFKKRFGRYHGGLVEEYKCNDADAVIVCMGSLADQAIVAVDELREEGYRVGAVNLRVFRPFPDEEIRRIAKNVKAISVIDRNLSPGKGGASASELKAALYIEDKRPQVLEFIAGLGGRDVTVQDQKDALKKAIKIIETGETIKEIGWIGRK